tara:strand:- start:440 stop:1363 length:924 start_codon:yes stop_codon:yes gene_type:complete
VFGKQFWAKIKAALNPGQAPVGSDMVSLSSSFTITDAESALGCEFPAEVREIYEATQGLSSELNSPYALRLLSLQEVVSLHTVNDSGYVPAWWRRFGMVAFWTDDNSNYFAVRLDEPGRGMMSVLVHDDPDPSPVYRSISSFLDQVERGGMNETGWYEWQGDYPLPDQAADVEVATRQYFWDKADRSEGDEVSLWFQSGAVLIPKEQISLLYPKLESSDGYTRSAAMRLIIRAAPPEAMSYLKRMVIEGPPDARRTAMYGIEKLAGEDSISILQSLADQLEPNAAESIQGQISVIQRRSKRKRRNSP